MWRLFWCAAQGPAVQSRLVLAEKWMSQEQLTGVAACTCPPAAHADNAAQSGHPSCARLPSPALAICCCDLRRLRLTVRQCEV